MVSRRSVRRGTRQQGPAPRRSWLAAHLAVWIGALCLLLGQFSSILHMATVQHVRCAEHGEWIHAGDPHGPSDVGRAQTVVSGETESIRSAPLSDGHEHDHCLLFSEDRRVALFAGFGEHQAPRTTTAIAALCSSPQYPSQSVYSFAPKTSPPVA